MKIEDIIVKIKLADEEQKQKGMFGFAVVRFRVSYRGKTRHIAIKGFVIRRSEYKDEFGKYCAAFPPSSLKKFGGYIKLVFFENEFFKEDKEFWDEIANRILEEYYKKLTNKESDYSTE